MKITAVQLQPTAGDIPANLDSHAAWIRRAAAAGSDLIFFPELSLSGYEPSLAAALAMSAADSRLALFQQLSTELNVRLGIGLPLAAGDAVQIGMLWCAPDRPPRVYAKRWLHHDELPFFVAGEEQLVLVENGHTLTPAICYESLRPEHAAQAAGLGATVYLASVAKPAGGLAKGMVHYPHIARQHEMWVILANCLGPSDDFVSVGGTAVWHPQGELLAQLDGEREGFLTVDTEDGEAVVWQND